MRVVKTAEERKNEILDVAEQLFAEKGFDAASTNDIINRIGIARGTLYHHFASKEEILDAIVDRMTRLAIYRAGIIIADKRLSVIERLTATVKALNIKSDTGTEVLEQLHRPQNALLHQKMQDRLVKEVVPLYAILIKEGNKEGIFNSKYPAEAAEMIMIYSNAAFDDLAELTPGEKLSKGKAFVYHIERILGAEEGSLSKTIMSAFKN
ncbi:TetR/AcrR family transcriptional regulator [Butyrivibrio sp. XPD2006]|uniref:TetR/AcrR family transcriptional regulator n=1 Tax=Butyrivibrio sp. XPD2006 TaxID=1280668 RepID=UPI0003B35BE4|nr:TetR/AcrR family transcriptional regulator [Butyrivibrio sp. XPD2006]